MRSLVRAHSDIVTCGKILILVYFDVTRDAFVAQKVSSFSRQQQNFSSATRFYYHSGSHVFGLTRPSPMYSVFLTELAYIFREDAGFMSSLDTPTESREDRLIRTGLRNPFDVQSSLKDSYNKYLREQLHDRGHEQLLQYHDPEMGGDGGSDTDFEEPDMDLIDEHVANKPDIWDSDGENDTAKKKPVKTLRENSG